MEPSLVEGRGEVDVGKSVSNRYKSGVCFLYPYLLFIVIALN